MKRRISVFAALLVSTICQLAFAEKGAGFEELATSTIKVDLCGAQYYRWISPEHGRVVVAKDCVPAEGDCDHDVLAVFDQEGGPLFEGTPFLDVPGMTDGRIFAAALRTPDMLVVSTTAGHTGYEPVLAEYEISSGVLVRVIKTGSVHCWDLFGDDEGIIWCLGGDGREARAHEGFDLVHRFDESGDLLGSSLPRSTFDSGKPWKGLHSGFIHGHDQVRLWLSAANEIISFGPDGAVEERLVLPSSENMVRSRMAGLSTGEVFALLTVGDDRDDADTWSQALYRLSPDGSSWLPLVDLPMKFTLVGSDDENLILLDRESLELVWYPLK